MLRLIVFYMDLVRFYPKIEFQQQFVRNRVNNC